MGPEEGAAAEAVRALFPSVYLHKFLAQGIRPDGREAHRTRDVSWQRGVVGRADGSAAVEVGRTSAAAAVSLEPLLSPVPGTPCPSLNVTVHLGPIASPSAFSSARPSPDQAAALSAFLSRSLTGSRVVDFSQLSVKDSNVCWAVNVAVTILTFDGNIEDCAILAATLALIDTKIPPVEVNDSGDVLECDGRAERLKILHLPLCLTLSVVEMSDGRHQVLADPTDEEERLAQASVTVVLAFPVQSAGEASAISTAPVTVHKPGGIALQPQLLRDAIRDCRNRAASLASLLSKESLV